MAKRHTFAARLFAVGNFLGVAVPRAVSRAFGRRGSVPVVLRVARGGEPRRTSLSPDGKGGHVVFVHGKARKAAGVGLGDRVSVELTLDETPRGVALPPDLEELLRDEGVLEAWWSFPPGRREQVLRWVEQAVHEDTRLRRLVRVVEQAQARREKLVDEGM